MTAPARLGRKGGAKRRRPDGSANPQSCSRSELVDSMPGRVGRRSGGAEWGGAVRGTRCGVESGGGVGGAARQGRARAPDGKPMSSLRCLRSFSDQMSSSSPPASVTLRHMKSASRAWKLSTPQGGETVLCSVFRAPREYS